MKSYLKEALYLCIFYPGEIIMIKNRILLVEDNEDNFELVRFLLERAGYEVLEGHDGQEALTVARLEHPDLILMDLSLPGMDGWEAGRELKASLATSKIPLLALTAHTLPGDRKRTIDSGFDGYISKPIDVANFGETIGRALENNKAED
jgi:two-component system, cell cycle response regulator DivK